MKILIKSILTSILAMGFSLLFNGCAPTNPDASQMPWGQPAEWEQKGPGMPGGAGGSAY